jgi:hypothetical protein
LTVEQDRRCPRCDAPYDETQEYCLECGQRLPERSGVVAVLGSAWRRRMGWYPGDWVWPALLALLVAAVAGVISALWLADRSSSAVETVVETAQRSVSLQATQTPPEPTTSVSTPTAPPTGTARLAPPPSPPPTLVRWPTGREGWTIVLDSVPAVNGRAGAVNEARQALHLGLEQVGVLDSARFSSLHPGYFVVFSGIYGSEPEAQSHVIEAHRHGYRGPYVRRITP